MEDEVACGQVSQGGKGFIEALQQIKYCFPYTSVDGKTEKKN